MIVEDFKILFQRYYSPLVNYSHSFTKDEGYAEDVVQDVFTQVWKKQIPLIEGKEGQLLFKMVRNKSIDFLRQKNQVLLQEYSHHISDEEVTEDHDTFMLKEIIIDLMRQLPPKCQNIFRLTKINGLSYAETAEELGISTKTVEAQITIAYRKLRKLIKSNSLFDK